MLKVHHRIHTERDFVGYMYSRQWNYTTCNEENVRRILYGSVLISKAALNNLGTLGIQAMFDVFQL